MPDVDPGSSGGVIQKQTPWGSPGRIGRPGPGTPGRAVFNESGITRIGHDVSSAVVVTSGVPILFGGILRSRIIGGPP